MVIRLENLHKSFDDKPVLSGVDLEIPEGEIVALIGPSGEGKSVLLKHIVGLLKPDKGRVLIDGQDIGRMPRRELEQLRRQFGYLFQNGALFNSMTLFENIAFPLQEKTRLSDAEIRERVLEQLRLVGLPEAEDKLPAQVSGGMLKRAALARELVQSPRILLFDEPTTGLDPLIVSSIQNLIHQLHQRLRFTGIVVTHEIPRIFGIVQKVAMLYRGRIRFFGTPEAIQLSNDPVVAGFIRGTTGEEATAHAPNNGGTHA